MIKIEHLETCGWEAAIRGMRNPKNSWDKSDTLIDYGSDFRHTKNIVGDNGDDPYSSGPFMPIGSGSTAICLGPNDADLMKRLRDGGPVHAKYRRMITVYCDITAPLYWWKEYDTYKMGTVTNSCSTMHKLGEREFELEDFSYEKLMSWDDIDMDEYCVYKDTDVYSGQYDIDLTNIPAIEEPTKGIFYSSHGILFMTIKMLNKLRELWLASGKKDKSLWYQMIQLLPTSYNQKRTVELNYEVLAGMYKWRKDHKLDEWREFCSYMARHLPESWIFTGEEESE